MIRQVNLKLLPSMAADHQHIRTEIAAALGLKPGEITGFNILRRSVDARGKQPHVVFQVQVFAGEPFIKREALRIRYDEVSAASKKVLIAGAGPAGLFAALRLIELGIRPVIMERGKEVRERRRDLAALNKEGLLDPDSNYCFGEGGAGTYSDGKLYTRSTKRGDVERILSIFITFGAPEEILYESHPHIGTNKLPGIISAIREKIIACGGEIHFSKKLSDLIIKDGKINGVITSDGDEIETAELILCTGHSARDIFELLSRKNILIESKPFALGVRIEHPQPLIDRLQYHSEKRNSFLPPASYSLVEQVEGRGVFSFCMCPGGIIAPAATGQGELVVNGWSPSRRNNPFANSGMVATVDESDFRHGEPAALQALAGVYFQRSVERRAFAAGGGKFVAPAQRMTDFVSGKMSAGLPGCSYLPGVRSADLREVLPPGVYRRIASAFRTWGEKKKGYFTSEAIVVATESRTSSPVRIPRDRNTLEHPQVQGLYPCGEGAGYAGGIVSAAMDGERVAERIGKYFGLPQAERYIAK